MIRRTDTHADLDAMRAVLERVYPLFDGHAQLSVTCRADAEDRLHDIGWLPDGARDSDYTVINPEFRGTVVEELLDKLPFPYGRTRLMRMAPKSCLSIHADSSLRYHYAITTNPDCYIIFKEGDTGTLRHIPADGHLYEMDARKTHTAINASRKERVHLVICALDRK